MENANVAKSFMMVRESLKCGIFCFTLLHGNCSFVVGHLFLK